MKKILLATILLGLSLPAWSSPTELQQAYEAFLLKDYAGVVKILSAYKAIKGDPLLDYYLWALGRSQLETGDMANGQIHLEELLKLEPDSLFADGARAQIGRALQAQSKTAAAPRDYLRAQLPTLSGDAKGEALYYLALAESDAGEKEAALHHLRQSYLEFPSSSVAEQAWSQLEKLSGPSPVSFSDTEQLTRADRLFDAKLYLKALDAYEPLMQISDPAQRDSARLKKGEALYALKRYGDAELFLEPGPAAPPAAARGALLHLGMSWLHDNNEAQAVATFERAQRLYPGTPEGEEALYRIGMIALQAGRASEATAAFSRLAEAYPHGNFRDKGLWASAWAAYRRSDWDSASKLLTEMEKGAADAATQGKAIYWEGRVAERQGKVDAAKAGWQHSADVSPLSYYGFMALKKLKGQETLSDIPAVPPAWKIPPIAPSVTGSENPADKTGRWDLHFRKAAALVQAGLGKLAPQELEASLKQNADKAAALSRLLEAARKTDAYFIPVAFSQKYWEHFKALFPNSKAAEDYRNHLQYPFAYRGEVEKSAARAAVSPHLVVALMRQESGFMPWITSGANAQGLMQLLPATAANRARALGIPPGDLYDPVYNILVGSSELKAMLDRFSGNWAQAFAAYNAGPARARQWTDQFGNLPLDEYIEEIPFSETNLYVKLVLRNYWVYKTLYP